MRTYYTVGLSVLAGVAVGAAAVEGIRAQAQPPIYVVTEIDVANTEGWAKDYAPRAQALIKSKGGRVLAASNKPTTVEGEKAKPRVAIQVWDSMAKFQAYRDSAEFKDVRKVAETFNAKFRSIAVEGVPQ